LEPGKKSLFNEEVAHVISRLVEHDRLSPTTCKASRAVLFPLSRGPPIRTTSRSSKRPNSRLLPATSNRDICWRRRGGCPPPQARTPCPYPANHENTRHQSSLHLNMSATHNDFLLPHNVWAVPQAVFDISPCESVPSTRPQAPGGGPPSDCGDRPPAARELLPFGRRILLGGC